jgi:hypothetical protein
MLSMFGGQKTFVQRHPRVVEALAIEVWISPGGGEWRVKEQTHTHTHTSVAHSKTSQYTNTHKLDALSNRQTHTCSTHA